MKSLAFLLVWACVGQFSSLRGMAHELILFNETGSAYTMLDLHGTKAPVGVTRLPLTESVISLVFSQTGVSISDDADYLWRSGDVIADQSLEKVAVFDFIPSFSTGFGFGLMIFGWGWVYRMVRGIPSAGG